MRSLIVNASPWSWVTKMNVIPISRWIRLSSICIASRSLRSRAASGSSSSSALGRLTSALARATRCCWPPDSCAGRRTANSARRTTSSISIARRRTSADSTFLARRPKATLSNTDMCGKRAYCWKTVLTLRLCGGTSDTSTPSSMTRPLVGRSKPAMIFSSVVFPHPEGPSKEKNSPRRMEKSARSTATNVPNSLRTPSRTMTSSSSRAGAESPIELTGSSPISDGIVDRIAGWSGADPSWGDYSGPPARCTFLQ